MSPKCTLQTCSGRASCGKTVPWSLALLLAAVAVSSAAWWLPVRLHSATTLSADRYAFLPTRANTIPPPKSVPEGMVWIPGGEFSMGSADPRSLPHGGGEAMEDARPIHRVYVNGLWMDKTDVTNAQFARFVKATGYKTIAERKPQAKDFPGVAAKDLVPGSIVFTPPSHSVPLNNYSQWWSYVPGADWQHPLGPHSSIRGREQYPVVQIAYDDAAAYAKWAGKRLPTEAEWEFAARGSLTSKPFVWGDTFGPHNHWMANTHQGNFPDRDNAADGFAGIAPVAQYSANGYGLYDMSGNVWQWTSDWYRPDYYASLAAHGLARNPQGPSSSVDPSEPGVPKRVQRGGSFLCTEQYCSRYLVGSRGKGDVSSATNHIGFRCVADATMTIPPK
jgi:formylglycine-generating enzyme